MRPWKIQTDMCVASGRHYLCLAPSTMNQAYAGILFDDLIDGVGV